MTGPGGAPAVGPWLPVPGLEPCEGAALDLTQATWPKRQWTACGIGCVEASAFAHVASAATASLSSAAKLVGGELYLRTSIEAPPAMHEELVRLADEAPLFILRVLPQGDVSCGPPLMRSEAPFLLNATLGLGSSPDTVLVWVARYDLSTATLHQLGAFERLPGPTSFFTLDDGWGATLGGTVHVAVEPASSPEVVFSAMGSQEDGRARGGLAIWADHSLFPEHVRRWTKAGGAASLFQAQGVVVGLALGDERIAWVSGQGPAVSQGGYEVAEVYWSPRAEDPSGIVPHLIMDISGKVAGSAEVATVGDFVALTTSGTGKVTGPPGTFVHRISTTESWFIPARPGTFVKMLGMSTSEMVLAETQIETGDYTIFQRILRLSLGSLNELGQSL